MKNKRNVVIREQTQHAKTQAVEDLRNAEMPFRLQSLLPLLPLLARAMNARQMQLENLQLRDRVASYELAQTITQTLDPQTVISKLADAVLRQTDADQVSVLLPINDGTNDLYVAAVRGADRERLLGRRVPFNDTISGWVAREREPLILDGEVNDERFRPLWPQPEIASAMSIPLLVANKVVGTVNINSLNRRRPFTVGQMKVLTVLATTAAAALESASLYTQVRKAEEKYRLIFENAVEGIFQATPDQHLLTVNPSMARILGYNSPQELIADFNATGRRLWTRAETADAIASALEVAGVVEGLPIETYQKSGESIWLSLNLRLVKDENGVTLYHEGTIEDITARTEAELHQQELEQQLRQSQKMEAIGRLAGGVAHDFNNLLTAINGYSSLALQRANPDDRIHGYLEEIKRAGERAANLTRQLLAFGRKQMLKPVALNLNDVVSEMSKMLRRLIGEDIFFDAIFDPHLKHIRADLGQIEQVLVNLVVNGRDAMPQGGTLTIETANFTIDHEFASKQVGLSPGPYVVLTVSDNGCGMDEKTKARIFEPFFTTKEMGGGTGLGLSTVYGIVKQSGGNIWVYSKPGEGTVVKVFLPQFLNESEAPAKAPVDTLVPRGSETILLVEDEDVVRGLTRQILEQAGYNVLDTPGGEEAIRVCREQRGPIDLLLTDVVMPETSGKEVAERLTRLRPGTRVLYMSGYTDDAIVHHGVLDSNVEFIHKPFTPLALARKVREVLDVNRNNENEQMCQEGAQQ